MAEDDFDKAFEGHDDDEDETEEAAEDAEFESDDDEEEGGEVDPNDEDFSEEWSEVPLPKKEEPDVARRKIMRIVGPAPRGRRDRRYCGRHLFQWCHQHGDRHAQWR